MENNQADNLGLIYMPGCEVFGSKVEYYIKNWRKTDRSFAVKIQCPRFSSGEGKGLVCQSVRGMDLFLICDPFNYSVTYDMYGMSVPMSPDDHFQDLKRIVSAIGGKAKRLTVIMPMLYEGRQHKRTFRESLDCALALQELVNMGVTNIVTFDAHDPRVQNAIPLNNFDNVKPRYQMVKALVKVVPDIHFETDKLVMISPDEGGVSRCLAYSTALNLDIGMFYKRRDLTRIVNGANPIEAHEYIGNDLAGKDAIVVDDMIASGGSILDTFHALKKKGARRIFAFITFGSFSRGYEAFDAAYEQGLFDKIFLTNLIYMPQALLDKPWTAEVDLSKYTAYVIDAISSNASLHAIIDPNKKIMSLLDRLKNPQ